MSIRHLVRISPFQAFCMLFKNGFCHICNILSLYNLVSEIEWEQTDRWTNSTNTVTLAMHVHASVNLHIIIITATHINLLLGMYQEVVHPQ